MVASILVLNLELFIKAASAMLLLLLILEIAAMSVMRESRLPSYQPSWRTPFYPWLHIAGLVAYFFLLVELGSLSLAVAGSILGAGMLWYVFRAKAGVVRESALVRLAERIAATDFSEHSIEAELADIVRERDQLVEDRFRRVVCDCTVLDLPNPLSMEECLRLAAAELALGEGIDGTEAADLLVRRESLSSTVVCPGVAVPHLIDDRVPGFVLVVMRCLPGVAFGPSGEVAHAIFAVATPPTERDFYLRALMAIAEIAGAEGFDERWRRARSAEELRDVILSAERQRRDPNGSRARPRE
jgi:mannitol/fructose-specific phosphotransferase system IIA component (Ntr-type)